MAGFRYWLPGINRPIAKPEMIPSRCGLQSVFADTGVEYGFHPHGPGGGPGTMFAVAGSHKNAGWYDAEKQVWTPVSDTEGVTHWVGWDKDDRPGPECLKRKNVTDGHLVELNDGNKWVIPAVHLRKNSLPKVFRLVDGELRLVPIAGYEDLTVEADYWLNIVMQFNNGEGVEYKPGRLFRFAVQLLGVNYRVGVPELASGVDILSDNWGTFVSILNAAFGIVDLIEEMEAKKEAATA